jgi:hypothetical protein
MFACVFLEGTEARLRCSTAEFKVDTFEVPRLYSVDNSNHHKYNPHTVEAWNVSFVHVGGLAPLINWLTLVS